MNLLQQLKQYTQVVADTGNFQDIKQYKPVDATTNPSLIYAAAQDRQYAYLIEDVINRTKGYNGSREERLDHCLDLLAVSFGLETLKIVPRRVSTEVSADLSFDTEATLLKAGKLISLYEEAGISRSRILIKIASTWEGIKAAEILEKEGIHCNLTLLFSMPQAIACAEAGVTLISPFVGRIYDWYKKSMGVDHIPGKEDPGVLSVREIFHYYKKFGYTTEIMGASFRNSEEIIELAGCDLLTISPELLSRLESTDGKLDQRLNEADSRSMDIEQVSLDEADFRWLLNENAMATEKLAEGIRRFNADLFKLKEFMAASL
jgi:transaldolase